MEVIHIVFLTTGAWIAILAIWIAAIDNRLHNLVGQQEEYWQRHLKNHPRGD